MTKQEILEFSKSIMDRAILMGERVDVLNKLDNSPSSLSTEFDSINIIQTGVTMLSTQGRLSAEHALRIFEVMVNIQSEILEARLAEVTNLKKGGVV